MNGRFFEKTNLTLIISEGDTGEYQLIDLNPHFDDAHIDLAGLKFVLFFLCQYLALI